MRRSTGSRSRSNQELRRILESDRDRVLDAVRLTIREVREEGALEDAEVQDRAERSEADAQGELGFGLLQMFGETLEQIGAALDRLDAGRYGFCVDCRGAIASGRLRALPFATRCRDCEQQRETNQLQQPPISSWQKPVKLFDMVG